MTDWISTDLNDGVLTLTFNRPDKLNAMSLEMYHGIGDSLRQADQDPQVRVLCLKAQGDHFCAGNEIELFAEVADDQTGEAAARLSLAAQSILQALAAFGKPIVASVQGVAVGIGTTMLLHCDLIYAARDARFRLPFIDLGLVPEGGSSHILPQLVGYPKAAELLMLGEFFDAATARDLGLITSVCDPEALQPSADLAARKLVAKPASALRMIKRMLRQNPHVPLSQVIDTEIEQICRQLKTPAAAEAMSAFIEKRPADFSKLD
ncbi:enoyl-CoA hydratase [Motiliproteus sp.]|uniref:enoyl-CoA hydratase n=1 Tax=Motiliproteus sp. TaxID=1898955 RepID=UPI003BAD8594